MSEAVAPNNTYIEGTSKAVSANPINNVHDYLKKNDACEIVEANSLFLHNNALYSNGPFINATLQTQIVGGAVWLYEGPPNRDD